MRTLAVVLALAIGTFALQPAQAACSNATLNGEYAFGVTNYTAVSVAAGIKYFDGQGNLVQRDYRGDSLRTANQQDFAPLGSETGTYKVFPDCTGSMVLTVAGGLRLDIRFVVSDGGRHIHEVVAQATPPGLAPQPVQTSADDWKVAAEEENQQ